MLKLTEIQKSYQMGENTVYALRGVSLTIEDGDFVAIMGPSGSGKSTLMHVMGLLDVPDKGSYQVNGREVAGLTEDELAVLRREEIGFIFQQFNLLARLSALENVGLPLMYSEHKVDIERAAKLLDRVGLGSRSHHRPNEMSGGQQQRVAIARSLINKPMMILADEPTGNLDSTSEKEIMGILRELNESGITVVIVTHEEEIGHQARRLIRMRDGVVQSDERLQPMPVKAGDKQTRSQYVEGSPFEPKRIIEHFNQGVKSLLSNKIRTALSMLGILIGVGAVVAMLALGRGAQTAIQEQLSSLGSNLLVLVAGAARGPGGARAEVGATTRLTVEDAAVIEKQINNIKTVGPLVNGRVQAAYGANNWNTSVTGAVPSYARMHDVVPIVGRFFSDEELQTRQRVAVIGATLVTELFKGKHPIGATIKLNRISFLVIGVLPEKGGSGFMNQDDKIIIPVTTAMRRLLGKTFVDQIEIEAASAEATEEVTDNVLNLMYARKKIPLAKREEAYDVRNMSDIQAAMNSSTQTMTALLAIISAISLFVGGIGIMNIMLVSVTERTKEIGLRKAVGARRSDILAQFLVESIVISAIGGILGILLAWFATLLLSAVAGWSTSISLSSVVTAVLFSSLVGVVFGLYPARKASLLPPIDALRFE